MPDNRNFILAIVLSIVVIFGWQYFFAQPQVDKLKQQQQQTGDEPGPNAAAGEGSEGVEPAVGRAAASTSRPEGLQ